MEPATAHTGPKRARYGAAGAVDRPCGRARLRLSLCVLARVSCNSHCVFAPGTAATACGNVSDDKKLLRKSRTLRGLVHLAIPHFATPGLFLPDGKLGGDVGRTDRACSSAVAPAARA